MKDVWLCVAMMAAAGGSAWCETVTLTLDNAGALARRHSAALDAARWEVEEARAQMRQAGRWANPELEGGYTPNMRSAEHSWEVGVSQKVPVGPRLRWEKAAARGAVQEAEALLNERARQLTGRVREGIVRVLATRQERALRDRQRTVTLALVRFYEDRVRTGEAGALEREVAELEARQMEAEGARLDGEEGVQLAELSALLGLKEEDRLVVAGTLEEPRTGARRAIAAAVGSRSDWQAARAAIETAESEAALARAERWEDIEVGVGFEREYAEDAPEGFEQDDFVGVRMTVPLPLWDGKGGAIAAAEARVERRRREADALAAEIRGEVAAARRAMALWSGVRERMERDVVPAARSAEERVVEAHEAGQASLADVLRARERRLGVERESLEALRDYHMARVRLETAAGGAWEGGK